MKANHGNPAPAAAQAANMAALAHRPGVHIDQQVIGLATAIRLRHDFTADVTGFAVGARDVSWCMAGRW